MDEKIMDEKIEELKPDFSEILTKVIHKLYVFETVGFLGITYNCYPEKMVEIIEGFFFSMESMAHEMIDQLNELRDYADKNF